MLITAYTGRIRTDENTEFHPFLLLLSKSSRSSSSLSSKYSNSTTSFPGSFEEDEAAIDEVDEPGGEVALDDTCSWGKLRTAKGPLIAKAALS